MPIISYWYRGWSMLALGALMAMVTVGSVTYGYGIYLTPVASDLGLSRETMNTGLIFQYLASALLAPLMGRWLDRFSMRLIVAGSGVMLGGALIGLGIGTALWPKVLLLILPLSLGFLGAGTIASYVIVGRWFKSHRGRAMALVAIGQTGSTVIVAPMIAKLIETEGWRDAIMYQGIAVIVILTIVGWMIVERPSEGEVEPVKSMEKGVAPIEGVADAGVLLSYREIICQPVFWMMALIVALTLSVVLAMIASLVPLATDRGLTLVEATTLLSSLGISGMAGKLGLAFIADRVDRRTLMIVMLVMIFGFVLSLTVDFGSAGLLIGCLACGAATGGVFPVYSAMLSDRFGAASLGTLEGLVTPMMASCTAFALWAAGKSFDVTGDYQKIFLIFSGVLMIALILAIILRFGMQGLAQTESKQ